MAFVCAYIQCLNGPVNWFSLTFCILIQVFLLLTVTLRGVSNKHCLLPFFILQAAIFVFYPNCFLSCSVIGHLVSLSANHKHCSFTKRVLVKSSNPYLPVYLWLSFFILMAVYLNCAELAFFL